MKVKSKAAPNPFFVSHDHNTNQDQRKQSETSVASEFSCSLLVMCLMFHWASSTRSRLHADVSRGYFRPIFPRLKHRGCFLLWCGDGTTEHVNRAVCLSHSMFYSAENVWALFPFIVLALIYSGWQNMCWVWTVWLLVCSSFQISHVSILAGWTDLNLK